MNAHIVIIGGGFGGLEAAFSLKELVPPIFPVLDLQERGGGKTIQPPDLDEKRRDLRVSQ